MFQMKENENDEKCILNCQNQTKTYWDMAYCRSNILSPAC